MEWYTLYYAVLLLPAKVLEVLQNTHDLIYYLRNSSIIGLKTISYIFIYKSSTLSQLSHATVIVSFKVLLIFFKENYYVELLF